jgi:flavin-dependent dehydrogenase
MQHAYEVVIAGGGPAGSSTANFLCQRGRRVLLLERARFPRFCVGESLLPFSNDDWKELGVWERMEKRYIRKPGARFIHEESGLDFTYYFDTAIRPGRPYAFHVKRGDFDKLLLDRAAELGAEVEEETRVLDVDFAADGVTVHLEGPRGRRSVTAELFVDATGREALTANRRRLKVPDELITTNVALGTHYRGCARMEGEDEGNIIIGLFDGGWYWVIPFSDGDTSLGVVLEKRFTKINRGASPEEMFYAALESTPYLRERVIGRAERVLPIQSNGNWSYRSRVFYGDRLLLVGDSAAFVDPLFSSGVLLAVSGARFAAEHIDAALTAGDFRAERFAPYQEQCLAGMDLFKGLIHEFYGENLRSLLITSAHNPTVCSTITSILAGDVYRPSLWHSIVKSGFSHHARLGESDPSIRSSRDLLRPGRPGRSRQVG